MSGMNLFIFAILLMLIEVPVGLSLFIAGSAGVIILTGIKAWLNTLGYFTQPILLNNTYIVIPLFLLMGQIAAKSDLSETLVTISKKLFGGIKSGAGVACIITSALFGAICGSSIATIASLGGVFYKMMKSNRYSDELIFGVIAAGGTLGILIPPSIVLIVYAISAQESIGKLFTASVPLAIVAVIGYIIAIFFYIKYNEGAILISDLEIPKKIQENQDNNEDENDDEEIKNSNIKENLIDRDDSKIKQLYKIKNYGMFFILISFVYILSLMYQNLITPAECASGITSIMIIYKLINDKIFHSRWINYDSWFDIFTKTAKATGMIIFIFLGASIFNAALSLTGFPAHLSKFVLQYSDYPLLIIFMLVIVFLILGCIMDGLAMVLLFAPLLYPIITKLDILPKEYIGIWFGVLMLNLVEVGMITPPVGINLFVIKQTIKKISHVNVMRSVSYFLVSDLIRISILIFYPQIILFLLK